MTRAGRLTHGCPPPRQVTPQDLIQGGLYKALALAYYPPPFRHVSACLVALALGAVPSRKTLVSMRGAGRRGMLGKKASASELPVAVEVMPP